MNRSRHLDVAAALETLVAAGAVFSLPLSRSASLGLKAAAAHIDVGADWLRQHKELIPGWWRLPGGTSMDGRALGELRFPVAGLETFVATRQRVAEKVAPP